MKGLKKPINIMQKSRAELHCHSIYSKNDGVLTPRQIVTIAKKKKIAIIALTDHNEINAIEIFNSRTTFNADNQKAKRWASENNVAPFVGSDAHDSPEFSMAINILHQYNSVEGFKNSLLNLKYLIKKLPIVVYLLIKILKFEWLK